MTRSNDLANIGPGVQTSNRNILINGDMKIRQRATLTTTTNTYQYTADRWWVFSGASTVGAPIYSTTTTLPGFFNILRVGRQGSNTGVGAIAVGQTIESINVYPLQGKTVTLSFWARSGANFSSASSALLTQITQGTGIDQGVLGSINQTWTGFNSTTIGTATLSQTWQKFYYTYSVPLTATELNVQFLYIPTGTAGANDWFDITGVQLELGSVPTPFECRPIGQELALCQRYYFRASAGATSDRLGLNGVAHSAAGSGSVHGLLSVTMRVAPTLSFSSINIWNGAANYAFSSVGTQRSAATAAGADINFAAGPTAGQSISVTAASAAGYWDASAEL